MPTLNANELTVMTARILAAAGATDDYADIVATHLVNANLAGHDSHGVIRIPSYLASIDAGRVDPAAAPAVTYESASMAQIDGANTFGQVTAKIATELAIDKARAEGVSLVTMFQIGHTGRLGTYAEMAAAADMGAVIWDGCIGGTRSIVAPLNGKGRKIGANPIAMGFPSAKHGAVVLDIATSMSAAGKVMVAQAKGEKLPDKWIMDKDGVQTDDAMKLNDGGALLPLGMPSVGHKGFALAMMTGFFTMLASLPSGEDVPHGDRWGTVILMVDISRFGAADLYKQQVDLAIDYVKAEPLDGEILYPGEIEARRRTQRLADGIELPDATWRELLACAERFGVPVNPPRSPRR